MTSYGRAAIENVNYASGDIFNFSSATWARFSTLTLLFPSLDKLSKKTPLGFLIRRDFDENLQNLPVFEAVLLELIVVFLFGETVDLVTEFPLVRERLLLQSTFRDGDTTALL